MFLAEIGAGLNAGSASLQADALDFLGDAANYPVSLGVAGMAIVWRARVAFAKGASLVALALWVVGVTVFYVWSGALPKAPVMGVVGVLAFNPSERRPSRARGMGLTQKRERSKTSRSSS
jgi:Co/Zn/Cd efflux system component